VELVAPLIVQEQQKNMMEQLGQQILQFKYSKESLGGCGTQTVGLGFGGFTATAATAATEEWTGAGAPLTKTITVS
jgi:hypothetical protein